MDLELLYHKTPIWLQNAVVSLVGWRTNRRRYCRLFERLLREYEERSKWTREDILRFRDNRIHAFAMHCEKNVPYYRDLFRDLKISGKDIRGLAELGQLPVLRKSTVQERYDEFLARDIPPSQRIVAHTSGTTGGGLRFATTAQALSEQWAVWWRYRRMHGLNRNVWCGYFAGRSIVPLAQHKPPFWRFNYPARQLLFSGYHMSRRNMGAYVNALRINRPPWLHGYPSLLALLASYMIENGVSLGYQVRWITAGAESLLQHQSKVIQSAFGIRPIQHYGMAEAVASISEDRHGVLLVDEDFSAVEFLRNRNGPGYWIVGTNLSNPALPLLRYNTMDLAELPRDSEDSGGAMRVVAELDGRREDYVVLQNGARIGRMDHVFKDLVRIKEAQIFQKDPGAILIRVVRGEGYTSEDESRLFREFRKRVGDSAILNVEYVSCLPRSAAGKLRFVVSKIPGADVSVTEEPKYVADQE